MKKAIMVWGGWDGHEPQAASELVKSELETNGFSVELHDTLDAFKDEQKLQGMDLIVPCWTMGQIEQEQLQPVVNAVASGVGLAGWHGGMCDAFRNSTLWQFMCGGQWVSHPGGDGTDYSVDIVTKEASPITEGMKNFNVSSEQYYMHVDPAVRVLATTNFGDICMPVTWTHQFGRGRVFYTTLGHKADIVAMPEVLSMIGRGMIWAAEGKAEAGSVEVRSIHVDLATSF